jgi:hypothetical protein
MQWSISVARRRGRRRPAAPCFVRLGSANRDARCPLRAAVRRLGDADAGLAQVQPPLLSANGTQ